MVSAEHNNLSNQFHRRLFRLQKISPPSAMAREILDVATDDQADLEQVVAVVEKQPELTARILRCANSAYYGHRGNIFSVADAIIRVLGLSITKALALSLAFEGSFRTRHCPGFKEDHYWLSAVLTATLSRQLTQRMLIDHRPDIGAAYTAGLMCNIGLLALVDLFPEEMAQVFSEHDPESETQKMRELLGIDAQQAGAFLGRRWGLPDPLVEAIAHCRDQGNVNLQNPLAFLVRVAVTVGDRLIHGEEDMDLPADFLSGMLDRSDVEEAVSYVDKNYENIRGMAQLLSGGKT
jgi:HD-like signal output (HDOD) protein